MRHCRLTRQQLVSFPRTYFEVKDVRPGKEQAQANPDEIRVSTPGEISVPGGLNQNVLQFLTGKELITFRRDSKSAESTIKNCKGLLFDAIQEQLDETVNQNGWQVNEHRFKKKDRVSINGINGYVVRVTKKYVYFV